MDPIYYQVNQTRLTENTQKSSDNLRIQQNKESKRKAQRAGDVEKSATTSDMTSMSDDMLGDMDPDDHGGSSSQQFAQMWKEQFGEERERPQDEAEDEAEDDAEGDEPGGEDGPPGAEPEALAEAPEATPSAPPAEVELSPEAGGVASTHARTASPAEQHGAASKSPPAGAPAEATANPVQARSGPTPTAEPASNSPDQKPKAAVVPPTGPATATAARAAAPSRASGPKSLLDFSSGFLIAEEAHWEPGAAETCPEVESEPTTEALPEDLSFLLSKLIQGDPSHPSYRKLQQLLSRFGVKVLRTCLEGETRVYLLPPGERLLAHPLLANCGESDLAEAAYLPQVRLCLFEDRCLAEPPYGFHPVFYYFAHAFDHALGGESFASLKSPAVRASYEACLEGSHRFGDLMAANSPAHYFAQAVESYLAENDCFEPLWSRHDLYDFDRSMYDYVEYLLGQKRAS